MNYWRDQPVNSLPHAEVQQGVNAAIGELMELRELQNTRENHYIIDLSFMLGIGVSVIAMFVCFAS